MTKRYRSDAATILRHYPSISAKGRYKKPKLDRQCKYSETLRAVRATIVAVEKK